MKYPKAITVALLAACALTATIATTAASAELPNILPETITEYTGKTIGSGEPEVEEKSGTKIKCTGATGEGTVESNHHLGLFHWHISGCDAKILTATGTCTGLGESSGIVLVLGSWHLVLAWLPKQSDWSYSVLFLVGTVHFTCSVSGVEHLFLVKLGGMLLCMIPNETALTKSFIFSCVKRATGSFGPEYTKYLNEKEESTGIAPLEIEENTNGKEEETIEIAEGTIETSEAALLMQ